MYKTQLVINLACNDPNGILMKIFRPVFFFITVLSIQSCSVSGPVHNYPGDPRQKSEIARVRIPAPITVEKIDGKKIDVPSNESGYYDIYLLPGLHRLDFKYELYWGDGTSGSIVESDDVAIETLFNAGMTYKMTYPTPTDEEEAFWMANDFKAKLLELETGRQVASRKPGELNRQDVKTTLVYGNNTADQPQSSPPAVAASTGITPPQGIDADTAAREDAVRRLKFWWMMADEAERKRFQQWIKTFKDDISNEQPEN